jgi:hypothetical protein
VSVVGLYDGPQMDTVLRQWAEAGIGADKANTCSTAVHANPLIVKGSPHALFPCSPVSTSVY